MENALKSVAGLPVVAMITKDEHAVMTRYVEELEDPLVLLKYMPTWLRSIMSLGSIKHPRIRPFIRTFMNALQSQSTAILTMVTKKRPLVPVTVNGEETTTYHQEVLALVTNLLNVFSLTVDAHIIHLLEQHKAETKPIHIFVGMNHAFRLAKLMDWSVADNTTFRVSEYRARAMASMTPIVNEWNEADRMAEDASAFLEFASKGKKRRTRTKRGTMAKRRHKYTRYSKK
jgi:hypothetical protein